MLPAQAGHRDGSKNRAHCYHSSRSGKCRAGQLIVSTKEIVKRLSQNFPARLAAFDQIKALIEEFCTSAALGPEDRHKLTLIVEELFTNTVNHGFSGDSDSPVSLVLEESTDGIRLTYEDAAPAYNPFSASRRTDIEATINERRVGGLGVFLAIGLTRRADYSFVDGRNRIALTFAPNRD
jgi:anti-sigma regulatory factor (Ser/Thr protein kinase)